MKDDVNINDPSMPAMIIVIGQRLRCPIRHTVSTVKVA